MNYEPLISIASVGKFYGYFLVSVFLWAVALRIYVAVTPYREFDLAAKGNAAAAASLSGVALGLAVPLCSLVIHSVSIVDMLIWSSMALIAQLALWAVLSKTIFKNLKADIEGNVVSVGCVLGAASLGLGMINAACLVY